MAFPFTTAPFFDTLGACCAALWTAPIAASALALVAAQLFTGTA